MIRSIRRIKRLANRDPLLKWVVLAGFMLGMAVAFGWS